MSDGPIGIFDRWRLINSLDLPGELVHLLLAILHYQGETDGCWVSRKTISGDLKIAPRTLRWRIKSLSEMGIEVASDDGFSIDFEAISKWEKQVVTNIKAATHCRKTATHCRPSKNSDGNPLPGGGNPLPQVRQPIANDTSYRTTIEQPLEQPCARTINDPEVNKVKFDPLKVDLPGSLDTPEVRDAWAEWVKVRRESRKTLTERACELTIKKLERAGPSVAAAALMASAENNWQGVFPEKYQAKPGKDLMRGFRAFEASLENDNDDYRRLF